MVIIVLPSLTSVTVSVRMVTILPFSIIVSVRIFCFLLENLKNEEEDEDEEDEDDDEDEDEEDEDVCFFTNPSKNLEQVTHMDPKEPEEDPNVEAWDPIDPDCLQKDDIPELLDWNVVNLWEPDVLHLTLTGRDII